MGAYHSSRRYGGLCNNYSAIFNDPLQFVNAQQMVNVQSSYMNALLGASLINFTQGERIQVVDPYGVQYFDSSSKLPISKNCSYCGSQREMSSKNCKNCGAPNVPDSLDKR